MAADAAVCFLHPPQGAAVCIHRGLETKLKHCLIGSDIFADKTVGLDARQQFSASPSGKIRDVSDAKKKALKVGRILHTSLTYYPFISLSPRMETPLYHGTRYFLVALGF